MKNIDKFKAKGVNSVICVAVNDPYTMNAWAEKLQAKDVVRYFTSLFDFFFFV
jgi:peroxiredoxin